MTSHPLSARVLIASSLLVVTVWLPSGALRADPPQWDRCANDGAPPPQDANCLKAAEELRDAGRPDDLRMALFRSCKLQRVWEGCFQMGVQHEIDGQAESALEAYDSACKNSIVMAKACKRAASIRAGIVPGADEAVRAPDGSQRSGADLMAADLRRQCLVDRVAGACTALTKEAMRIDSTTGKPMQPAAAARYASLLCEMDMDSAEHCLTAGVLLGKGEQIAPDYPAAYRMFSRGCLQQNANACVGAAATAMRLDPPDREAAMAAAEHALLIEPDHAKAKAIIERLSR